MSIGLGIQNLYPDARHIEDYIVQDDSDGRGPYVKHWNAATLGPMPSLEDLDAAGQQAEQEIAAETQDKSTLRDQIIGATEAQWLDLTEAQRQKVILKALKYLAKRI